MSHENNVLRSSPVQPEVRSNDNETKRKMLHELGRLIRSVGRREPKKHGNYWCFNIGDYCFRHDDYNRGVALYFVGKSMPVKSFGIDFGGFETRLDVEDFETALQIIKGFIKIIHVDI